jgi:serine/threonine protein kinase
MFLFLMITFSFFPRKKMNSQVKIGNYTILNSIGSGTFGKVKMAIHTFTGHKVALKILNRRRIVNMNMVARLKREVQYLQILHNPHVIKL